MPNTEDVMEEIVEGSFNRGVYVTHIKRMSAHKMGWMPLVYFTQIEEDNKYYLGHEFSRPITQEELNIMIESGEVKTLDQKFPITRKQSLWLTSNNEVYLADCNKPIEDHKKRKIV